MRLIHAPAPLLRVLSHRPSWLRYGALMLLLASPALANTWQAYGPSPQAYAGPTAGLSGRVNAIGYTPDYDGAGHPALFLAPAGGGVWRSTDFDAATPTWTPLTDNLGLPAAQEMGATAMGALAVDPNHPRTIYAGTGDQYRRGGAGILKSPDGGTTWTLVGGASFAGKAVTRIIVDPTHTDGSTLYCSVIPMGNPSPSDGIWKSTDGGATWENVNNGAAFAPWFNANYPALISDLEYTVNGSSLMLYAAAQGNGVWQSANGGATWARTGSGIATGSPIDMIKLAATHTSSATPTVYAMMGNANSGGLLAIYKSTNNGASWAPTTYPSDFASVSSPEQQEYYDLTIGVAPDGQAFLGGAYANMQSVDGGSTWVNISFPINVWVDCHSFGFAPDSSRPGHYRLYRGDDGGIWRFNPKADNTAGPGNWDDLSSPGLQTTLMYSLALHPTDPNIAIAGCQDTGIPRRDGTNGNIWGFSGNDYGETRYAPGDGNTVYTTSHGGFGRADDGGLSYNSFSGKMVGIADSLAFFPVYATCPPAPTHLVIGSNRLFETVDRAESWHAISPALANTFVSALSYSPTDASTIYAAFPGPKAHLFRTTDDGATWSADLSANGSWTGGTITGIAVDPADKDKVTIGLSATSGGQVWKTSDGGTTWANASGDLPAIPVNVLLIDPRTTPSTIYVGTDIGVWASTNGGTNWTRFGGGLPGAQVTDLALDTANNRLGAATFGRGAWVISLANATNHAPVANDQSVTAVQDVPTSVTLTATDQDNNPLTYSVVTSPTNGTLSGTAPNLTYTSAAGYTGPDSFTFKANDGQADSNVATVSINVTLPAPVITDFTPKSGPFGTGVTITGQHFGHGATVKFNGTTAVSQPNSDTTIQTTVPPDATTGPITVIAQGGTAVTTTNFTVTTISQPTGQTTFAKDITQTTATLHATINPGGQDTTAFFQWGTYIPYDSSTPAQDIGSGSADVDVTSPLTGLTPGTTYHYRARASNRSGDVVFGDSYFVTMLPVWGTALSFNGIDQRVALYSFGQFAPTGEITIEFWQKVTAAAQQSAFVLNPDDIHNRINAHTPWVDGTVYWDFGDIENGGRLSYVPPVPITGSWQHFAFVSSATGDFMKIYRNGVLEAQKTGHSVFTNVGSEMDIGGAPIVPFNGLIDDFRVWNVARTGADIQADYNKPLTGTEAGLVAYYRFDEGAGLSAVDATGGHNGVLVNGPVWSPSTIPVVPGFTMADAVTALRFAGGIAQASSAEVARLDVQAPSGTVDIGDAIRIARKAAGTDANP